MIEPTTRRPEPRLFLAMILAVLALVFGTLARPALAANLSVSTTADENNTDGDCSLREAIIAANTDAARDGCAAGSGADTVTVPVGVYFLSVAGANEDAALTGDLDLTGTTTITGAGARATVVRGGTGFDDRIFDNRGTTEISGLTISGGNAGSTDDGGGVRNTAGDLTLDESSVSGNHTAGSTGGIFSDGGSLEITDSTVSGNDSGGNIGGVYQTGGVANITNSTISDNLGIGVAVAIHSFLNIRSSTIANNTSSLQGGGIFTSVFSDTTVRNSIISTNATTNCYTETGSSMVSLGYNLERANDCGFADPNDLPNIDPMLGSLSNNGGPTDTHSLSIGSPAIDAGESDRTVDQRGVSRPQDGDNTGSATDDVGAFEKESTAVTFTVNRTGDQSDADLTDDRCDANTTTNGRQCTLRAAIEEANDTAGADTIEFAIDGTGTQAISPNSALPTITDTLTIDGYTQQDASPNTLVQGNDAVLNVALGGLNAGANGLEIEAPNCTIKGLVIRDFDGSGILITGSGATGNHIEGNFIGVNSDGISDRGNSDGVRIEGASNTVGGTQPEMRNVISGNEEDGVSIVGTGAIDNRVEGNYIGTTADGTAALGNAESGTHISGGASSNAIGATPTRSGNRIAHNGEDGASITNNNSLGNLVLSNRIYRNDGLGIDLKDDGVTANDTSDADTGSNGLQNFPTIRSTTRSTTGETTISGRLNSNPSQDYTIQCFLTGGAPASAHGEGFRLLDTTRVSTNASGSTRFTCASSSPLLGQIPGQTVSATATNEATGDSSEFSANETVIED